ncbi:MAG TPA: VOC family protein [Ignavibacteriaceae bacterium]|nr:VOC family protein [Ignavibacteriaceae bacterium]
MEEKHTITHIEIPSPDLQKSLDFYSKVFGWKTQVMPDNTYAMFIIGNSGTGGGFDTSTKPAQDKYGPGLVINVDDINSKLEEIKKAGGKVIQEKTEIPGGYGFYARFQDTNGNYLQIHSRE